MNIVNCNFVWKNGNYDAILASGTSNREDLLYLSLSEGKVELISGIGRPTGGYVCVHEFIYSFVKSIGMSKSQKVPRLMQSQRLNNWLTRELIFVFSLPFHPLLPGWNSPWQKPNPKNIQIIQRPRGVESIATWSSDLIGKCLRGRPHSQSSSM